MQIVEFALNLKDKVSFGPDHEITGVIRGLYLDENAIQLFEVRYSDTGGAKHYAWLREDELQPA